MKFGPAVLEDLWAGEKSIGFFVHEGVSYWVLDAKYNFTLDAEKDYRGYLLKGHITQDQYDSACESFRNGILQLTSDNFLTYVSSESCTVVGLQELKGSFDIDGVDKKTLLRDLEKYYLVGDEVNPETFRYIQMLASRLPAFYVNFDRRIFMHMDFGRSHEDLSYPGWISRCSDFCFLIPDAERYRLTDGDYWKFKFIDGARY